MPRRPESNTQKKGKRRLKKHGNLTIMWLVVTEQIRVPCICKIVLSFQLFLLLFGLHMTFCSLFDGKPLRTPVQLHMFHCAETIVCECLFFFLVLAVGFGLVLLFLAAVVSSFSFSSRSSSLSSPSPSSSSSPSMPLSPSLFYPPSLLLSLLF